MVVKTLVVIAAIGAFSVAAAADGAEPETLARKGDWVADYGPDGCHVYGQFGTGEDEVIAKFSRYDFGESFKFGLFGKRVGIRSVTEDVEVDFGLGTPVTQRVMSGITANRPALFFPGLRLDGWNGPVMTRAVWKPGVQDSGPAITFAQEASVAGVTIDIPGKPSFRLDAGSLDKPFIVLRDCMDKLARRWGYDPEVQRHLIRRIAPLNYPAEWLTDRDFPARALHKRMNAMVHFRLDVDAEGKITGCHVLDKSEPAEFGNTTCTKISSRAKLQPALDESGKQVASFVVHTFNWLSGAAALRR